MACVSFPIRGNDNVPVLWLRLYVVRMSLLKSAAWLPMLRVVVHSRPYHGLKQLCFNLHWRRQHPGMV